MKELLPAGNQAIDGCLAYHPVFDSADGTVYLVAPTAPGAKADGTRDYRILGFSVPDMKLVKTLPAPSNQSEAPYLELAPDRSPRAVPATEWRAVTALSLTDFAPNHEALPNQIIESSGDRMLLRIFAESPTELRLAVADAKAKTIVRLKSPPPATVPRAHLSPGGDIVLIEISEAGKVTEKTGKLALIDANTGTLLREMAGDHVRDQNFLAIAPNGKAVYYKGESYSFVDLGRTFGSQEVSHPLDADRPAVFFVRM
jgi:hypothetical protein